MFYFFRASPLPQPKVQERQEPRTGKLFLFLFFAFHALFVGFNIYYFMLNSNDSLENETNAGIDETFNEDVGLDTQSY